jgi:hypothetical protein
MNCYQCAATRYERTAVAVCLNSGTGPCLDHLREAQNERGGTVRGLRPFAVNPTASVVHGVLSEAPGPTGGDRGPPTYGPNPRDEGGQKRSWQQTRERGPRVLLRTRPKAAAGGRA